MVDDRFLPKDVQITDEDWDNTPVSIRVLILSLIKRIEELEAKLNRDSSNSNKPPSSDAPFKKPESKTDKKKGKPGARKGHKGHRQTLHKPTEVREMHPEQCLCGCSRDMVKTFCDSVLRIPISLGAIQKVIDRASKAIKPHYETIKDTARSVNINHVDETYNYAERMLRFGAIWPKRSYGSNSDKGCRWVERILSVRHTCRLHKKSTFDIITYAMDCYFKEQEPDVSWLKSMPV